MPTKRASRDGASSSRMASTSSSTSRAPVFARRSGPPPKQPIASARTAASAHADMFSDGDEDEMEGYAPTTSSKTPLGDRRRPSSKRVVDAGTKSRIPVGTKSTLQNKTVDKGKGREIVSDEPRRSPARRATHQNYVLNETESSEDEEDPNVWAVPRPPTTSQPRRRTSSVPVQTPVNARASTSKHIATPSSNVVPRSTSRARTASVAPGPVWSAIKPVPLKTVFLSSPPRPDRSSESESSSGSDDEVLLKQDPTTSQKRRKAAAGEYEWDERSRSCVPKRERSRSRSTAASVRRYRQSSNQVDDPDDLASDRSHLQDKIYQSSENDMLKNLLTNRLYTKVQRSGSEEAKTEVLGADFDDPFREQTNDSHAQSFDQDFAEDMPTDLPPMQDDNLGDQQPIFDFTVNGLPDDTSEDDDNNAVGRLSTFTSSDDGFEQSIIHVNDLLEGEDRIDEEEAQVDVRGASTSETIVKMERSEADTAMNVSGASAELEEVAANSVEAADSAEAVEGVEAELEKALSAPLHHTEESPATEARASQEPVETFEEDETVLEVFKETDTQERPKPDECIVSERLAVIHEVVEEPLTANGTHEQEEEAEGSEVIKQQDVIDAALRSMRSSSELSQLPPSSPPPLPAAEAAPASSDISEDDEDEMEKTISIPSRLSFSEHSLPLSPKSTNHRQDNNATQTSSPARPQKSRTRPITPTKVETPVQTRYATRRSASKTAALSPFRRSVTPANSAEAWSDNLRLPVVAQITQVKYQAVRKSPSPSLSQQTPNRRATSPANHASEKPRTPRLPTLTPVRLRSKSPAVLPSLRMIEASLIEVPAEDLAAIANEQPLGIPSPRRGPAAARSHSPASLRAPSPFITKVHDRGNSPLLSPPPIQSTTSKFASLSASIQRYASRSPSPLGLHETPRQRSPISSGVLSTTVSGPTSYLNSATQAASPVPTVAVPPSPFLSISQGTRSPSPNIEVEEAASSLLARVRALRSPSASVQSRLASQHTRTTPAWTANHALDAAQIVNSSQDDLRATPEGIVVPAEGSSPQPSSGPLQADQIITKDENASTTKYQPNGVPTMTASYSQSSPTPSPSDEISDTGLTDARSESDSEAESAEVDRSLRTSRTPVKSPGPRHAHLHEDEAQLSPNITLRRPRSSSRSVTTPGSAKITRTANKSTARSNRSLSFADMGALDSSPISIAASIGRQSFDALDTSSDDDSEAGDDISKLGRPSPSKAIAMQQIRLDQVLMQDEETSSDEDDQQLDLSSSPTRLSSGHGQSAVATPSHELLPTSTPSRLMTAMALRSSSDASKSAVAISTPNARRIAVAQPRPVSSPDTDNLEQATSSPEAIPKSFAHAGETLEDSAGLTTEVDSTTSTTHSAQDLNVGAEPPTQACREESLKQEESSQDLFHQEASPTTSHGTLTSAEGDTSALLDEARPRSSLVVPMLGSLPRPGPARNASRSNGKRKSNDDLTTQSTEATPTEEDLSRDPEDSPTEPQTKRARSRSVQSRAESVKSQASTVVQVSSADPLAAARAAAILKVHHQYIQDGLWSAAINPLARAASGSSEEGERALDDLLKQAEREVSAHLQNQSNDSQQSLDQASMLGHVTMYGEELRERSMSASRHFIDQRKLDIWTRHDWRALEQCFIDELRRKRSSREGVEPAEVVRLYLESEQLRPDQCTGEWEPEKLEIRVEALLARKQLKSASQPKRERSVSVVSTAYSRAPSDFFTQEDSRIHGYNGNDTGGNDSTFLRIPGSLMSPPGRRYARSAEPVIIGDGGGRQDNARHRGVSKYQSLQRRNAQGSQHSVLQRETSLSSVAEETYSIASEPPPSRIDRSVSRLYPSLDDLTVEMRPKKLLPVKGRSVAAAVNLFERIEEEQSMEAQREQAWLKRKGSDLDLQDSSSVTSKRARR